VIVVGGWPWCQAFLVCLDLLAEAVNGGMVDLVDGSKQSAADTPSADPPRQQHEGGQDDGECADEDRR
jgi:hypothetical protein